MAFYFSDYAEYSNPVKNMTNLASMELVGFLLKTCSTIQDVISISPTICITNQKYDAMGITLPLHWFCTDKTGRSAVLECIKGVPRVYENRYGVITNSPPFPDHVKGFEKLKRDTSLSSGGNNSKSLALQGQPDSYSLGTGLIGLPGDFTSISRFMRLASFGEMIAPPTCGHAGSNVVFHILNNFDIVKGMVVDDEGNQDFTQYTIVYDLSEKNVWIKTYGNQTIRPLSQL
jgi:choloylglycine hydrolase